MQTNGIVQFRFLKRVPHSSQSDHENRLTAPSISVFQGPKRINNFLIYRLYTLDSKSNEIILNGAKYKLKVSPGHKIVFVVKKKPVPQHIDEIEQGITNK